MNIQSVLVSGGILGTMGLIFGAGLAFASQKFAVEVDPKASMIRDVLPGANCGGCGYPGCDMFANEVVAGNAPVTGCPVGGADCANAIAEIMGVEAATGVRQVAKVICNGSSEYCGTKFKYDGIKDCKAATMILGGDKSCAYGCLGYGSCVTVCPFDAIYINDKGIAEVDNDKCTACGKCLEACPKDVIAYAPFNQEVVVECNNKERGGHVKKNCSVACIACGICERSCPFDAIKVENNIAAIDYDKCTECLVCVEKCPTKAISGDLTKKKVAFVNEASCIGCTLCKKVCPVDAIEGELKGKHVIVADKCIGCGLCEAKCPKDAIVMNKK